MKRNDWINTTDNIPKEGILCLVKLTINDDVYFVASIKEGLHGYFWQHDEGSFGLEDTFYIEIVF